MTAYSVTQFAEVSATAGTVDTITVVGPTSSGATDFSPTASGTRRIKGATIFNDTADSMRVNFAAGNTAPTVTNPSMSGTVSGYLIPAGDSLSVDETDGAAGAVLVVKTVTAVAGTVRVEADV